MSPVACTAALWALLALLATACGPVPAGQALDLHPEIADPAVIASFKDTAVGTVARADARTFTLKTPEQRDALHERIEKERYIWRTTGPENYRFLLRTQCFCPGVRGWLLIEVRRNQPLRAWDRTGKAAQLRDWDTFSIDQLFDNLDISAASNPTVQVGFDPALHFPAYAYTTASQLPDTWSIIEVRGLKPMR